MSDKPEREWRFYIEDMLGFAQKVQSYTDGLDQAGFAANGLAYDATLRNLELIGEAATHIPDDVRKAYPDIPWRLIVATRNRLIQPIWVSTTTRSGASFRTIFRDCWRPWKGSCKTIGKDGDHASR